MADRRLAGTRRPAAGRSPTNSAVTPAQLGTRWLLTLTRFCCPIPRHLDHRPPQPRRGQNVSAALDRSSSDGQVQQNSATRSEKTREDTSTQEGGSSMSDLLDGAIASEGPRRPFRCWNPA